MGVPETDPLAQLALPPGFRFYPTDEELLVQYLCPKAAGRSFSVQVIGDIDLYKFDPWMLPSKAMFGEKEWYFFSPRDRKYPNGSRPNRVAGSGYWKATGTDKVITTKGRKVGIKKALVFYVGKAPKGSKTNWIMHEYRLSDGTLRRNSVSSKLDDWVLCRIYEKNANSVRPAEPISPTERTLLGGGGDRGNSTSSRTLFESLPGIHNRQITAALPRTNSDKRFIHQHQPFHQHHQPQQQQQPPQQQQEESGIINRCGSASSRIEYWSTLLGMTLPSGLNPSLSSIGLGPFPGENWGPTTNGVDDDYVCPSSNTLPPLCHVGSPPRQDRFCGGQGWLFDGFLDDGCYPSFLYGSGGDGRKG